MYRYLEYSGPMAVEGFDPSEEVREFLHSCKICVIGAGGRIHELI